jgi:hypothetical protein
MIEDVLSKIARQIMALSEESLTALLPRYKERMLNFAPTREWEESVIVYFLINGLRIKNSQFNEKIKNYLGSAGNGESASRPRLRLVKSDQEGAPGHSDARTDGPIDAPPDADAPAGGNEEHPRDADH